MGTGQDPTPAGAFVKSCPTGPRCADKCTSQFAFQADVLWVSTRIILLSYSISPIGRRSVKNIDAGLLIEA